MRESLGTRLRQQREAQHITIASIAARTRIAASLFIDLERDDVSAWPSGVYRRSFIRTYAEAIGLDPDAVCREFVEQFPDERPKGGRVPPSSPMTAHIDQWQRMLAGPKGTLDRVGDLVDDARLPRRQNPRWRAAAWDAGALTLIGLVALAVAGRFWLPLAVAAVAYHVAGTLLLGKSPTLWWIERREADEELNAAPTLEHTASLR
jgi:transcriptional regulator with XRE-family HTH domain